MYAGRDKGKSTQSTDYFSFHVAGMHDTNLFMFLFGLVAISAAFLLVMRRHVKNRFWRTYRPCATDCVLHGCFQGSVAGCHFRNRGTESLSKSRIERMNGCAKR